MRTWTPEARARQAELCRRHKPWTKSTGPKTAAGKAAASQNARRHGLRSADYAYICAVLRCQRLFVRGIMDEHKALNRKRKLTPRKNFCEQTDKTGPGIPAGFQKTAGASFGKEAIMFENPPPKLPSFMEQSESTG